MKQSWTFIGALPLRAVEDLSGTLKRLSLFCDGIQLLMPPISLIEERVFKDPARVTVSSDGKRYLQAFNFHKDVEHGYLSMPSVLKRCEGEDKDTLEALLDQKIADEFNPRVLPKKSQKAIKELRSFLISCDVGDHEFNRISKTKPDDYNPEGSMPIIETKLLDEEHVSEETKSYLLFKPPPAVVDSFDLTTTLATSEMCGFQPIFPGRRHQSELEHKFTQYKKGLKILRDQTGETNAGPPSWRFGQAAYSLSNALFSSATIDATSITDILRYRNAMQDARARFISTTLFELTELIETSPWGQSCDQEVQRFVQGKLVPHMRKYQDESKQIWEKLFGRLTVDLANIVRSATIGSTGTGLLGTVLPGTSALQMLAFGALAGASKEAPKVVEHLVDSVLELRKHRRNGIAYIAKLGS